MNAIYMVVQISDQVLSAYNPDPWPSHPEFIRNYNYIVELLTPVGFMAFFLSIMLIILGLIIKRFKLSFLGAISLYLPIFANFAFIMFTFAGIGLIRIIWIILLNTDSRFLMLGDIILLPEYSIRLIQLIFRILNRLLKLLGIPYEVLSIFPIDQLLDLMNFAVITLMFILMCIGLGIFLFSVVTWLYGKFLRQDIIDFWIYKYSRHPQYLGLLISTYGLTSFIQPGYGSYVPNPTFFWIVTSLILIAIAIREENTLLKAQSDLYISWREKTPFLIYIPNKISFYFLKPVKKVITKEWPETDKEILVTILVYGSISVFLTLILFFIMGFISTIEHSLY